MAQILITHPQETHIYTPIASIKQYNEPDFEDKLWRYGEKIFEHYFVFKFKFPLSCSAIPGTPFEPDLLLVSKTFKKWVIIEVELCKTPTAHTLNQITCFSNPKINPKEITEFLMRNNPQFVDRESEFFDCFSNFSPDLIVVLDDYSDKVFKKFYDHKRQLKICVLEVYKRHSYPYEGFRFGGDYPYEVTNSSKIEYVDRQHYKIIKKDFIKDLPEDFEVTFDMEPFPASLIKMTSTSRTTFLKLPEHNIPSDIYLQLGINLDGKYVIQKL
jgi:hypothetical protein